jgi:hypothetical protein
MATELAKRVMVTGLVVTLPLALAAAIFFGPGAGAGVIGGALVALLNFGGLAREAVRATDQRAAPAPPGPAPARGLRHPGRPRRQRLGPIRWRSPPA